MARTAADGAIVGARIRTLDPERPTASAVAWRGGTIVATGDDAEVRAACDAGTGIVDLAGGALVPGLVDGHFHPIMGVDWTHGGVDLMACQTLDEARTLLAHEHERAHDGGWVVGHGLPYGVFPGGAVDGDLLAAAVGGAPAFVYLYDGHGAVATPRALELAGISGPRALAGNSEIVCRGGRPTGELRETPAQDLIRAAMPAPTSEQRYERCVAALRGWNALGLTGVHAMDGTPATLELLRELEGRGDLTLRMVVPLTQDPDLPDDRHRELVALRDARGVLWRCGAAKFFIDGTVDAGTAWLFEPDAKGECREPCWPDPRRYAEIVALFARAGFQCATHAIGDRAVQAALDAYRAAGRVPGVRHRVEHIETLRDEELVRFAGEDVVASMQPVHATCPSTATHPPGPPASAPSAAPAAGASATCGARARSSRSAPTGRSRRRIPAWAWPAPACAARRGDPRRSPTGPRRRSPASRRCRASRASARGRWERPTARAPSGPAAGPTSPASPTTRPTATRMTCSTCRSPSRWSAGAWSTARREGAHDDRSPARESADPPPVPGRHRRPGRRRRDRLRQRGVHRRLRLPEAGRNPSRGALGGDRRLQARRPDGERELPGLPGRHRAAPALRPERQGGRAGARSELQPGCGRTVADPAPGQGREVQRRAAVTAADVAFSVEQWRSGPNYGAVYAVIDSVETLDHRTVRLKLSAPNTSVPAFLTWSIAGIVPKHFGGRSERAFWQQPVGAGPFMVKRWEAAGDVLMVRNPHYFRRGRPYVDTVINSLTSDANQRSLQFRSRQVDAVEEILPLQASQYAEDRRIESPLHFTDVLLFNTRRPPFDDVRVRRAVALAIQYDGIVNGLYKGFAEAPTGFLPPNVGLWAPPGRPYFKQDAATARRVLAETGLAGQTIELVYPSESGFGLVAQVVQRSLQAVGVPVKLVSVETGTFLDQTYGGKFQLALWGYNAISPDIADPAAFILSTNYFFTGYPPTGLAAALKAYYRSSSEADKRAAVIRMQDEGEREVPFIALDHYRITTAVQADVEGVRPSPWGSYYYDEVWKG